MPKSPASVVAAAMKQRATPGAAPAPIRVIASQAATATTRGQVVSALASDLTGESSPELPLQSAHRMISLAGTDTSDDMYDAIGKSPWTELILVEVSAGSREQGFVVHKATLEKTE